MIFSGTLHTGMHVKSPHHQDFHAHHLALNCHYSPHQSRLSRLSATHRGSCPWSPSSVPCPWSTTTYHPHLFKSTIPKIQDPQQTCPNIYCTTGYQPHIHHPVLLWCCITDSPGMRPHQGCSHIWSTICRLIVEPLEILLMEDATGAVALKGGGM